jgi:hypothetical protein
MPKYKLLALIFVLLIVPVCAATAQSGGDGQFGCPGRTQFFDKLDFQFAPIAQDAIEQWQARPALAFDGFDETRYGFRQIALYRWREPVQGEGDSGDSGSAAADAVYRAQIAVRLMGARGDRWFELNAGSGEKTTPDELLYLQAGADAGGGDEQAAAAMAQAFSIRPATPDPALPLFLLDFSYSTPATGPVVNRLLLDARSGRPQISKAVQCLQAQPAGAGICDVPDRTLYDNLRCDWESGSGDFRCAMTSPFGGGNTARSARRNFYLFSQKPAMPDWYTAQSPADLGALAVQLRNQTGTASGVMVPDLGPVMLLARYKDLLPGSEVFIFASPGAGAKVNAHLSLVIVPAQGRATVERIRTWVLSGEKTDESARPRGYTPLPANDVYHTAALEDRAGFHAFKAVLTSNSNAIADQSSSGPTHVVYWIGVEAVEGKLVPSAVRVASDGGTAAACAQEMHDGTAISIERQQGMAAATVHVRPPDLPGTTAEQADDESDAPSGCVWIGGLYWKPGTGFDVRKVDEDCEAGMPEVAITADGQITVKAVQGPGQEP